MEFSQPSISPNSGSKRYFTIIVAIIVVLIVVAILIILSRSNNPLSKGLDANKTLSDQEKIEIMNQYPAPENPMTDEEKIKALEQVGSSAQVPSLSDEEKIKILNSI